MKKLSLFAYLLVLVFVLACLSVPAATQIEPTPYGKLETQVAASIFKDQTATAQSANVKATLTASVPQFTATPRPSELPSFEVSVPGEACWMNSEVSVKTGQTVLITATGTVNTWAGAEGSSSGPEGQVSICGAIQCPVQGVGYGALVGRLEDLDAFFVGTELEYTATKDGQLYFSVNDWECQDNSGSYELTIMFK